MHPVEWRNYHVYCSAAHKYSDDKPMPFPRILITQGFSNSSREGVIRASKSRCSFDHCRSIIGEFLRQLDQ
jgi:hypothetical protein